MTVSATSGQAAPAPRSLQQVMRQHPLFFFFLIACAFSWALSIPFVLSEWGVLTGDYTIIFIIKSFGPFLAAYVMIRLIEGQEGVLRLRQRIRQARAGWQWYAFILLVIPMLIVLGLVIQPGALASFQGLPPNFLVSYLAAYIAICFGGGPLGEEPGWRGFALPRLQSRYGALWGSLLLGVVWTVWHLPDFLTSQQGGGPGTGLTPFITNLPIFLLLVTALSIILAWVYNHTQGSILIAILAHASVNVPQVAIFPLFLGMDFTSLDRAALIALGGLALLIVALTRGRLGYKPDQVQ